MEIISNQNNQFINHITSNHTHITFNERVFRLIVQFVMYTNNHIQWDVNYWWPSKNHGKINTIKTTIVIIHRTISIEFDENQLHPNFFCTKQSLTEIHCWPKHHNLYFTFRIFRSISIYRWFWIYNINQLQSIPCFWDTFHHFLATQFLCYSFTCVSMAIQPQIIHLKWAFPFAKRSISTIF